MKPAPVQFLGLYGEAPVPVSIQAPPLVAELLAQHAVLFLQVVDHVARAPDRGIVPSAYCTLTGAGLWCFRHRCHPPGWFPNSVLCTSPLINSNDAFAANCPGAVRFSRSVAHAPSRQSDWGEPSDYTECALLQRERGVPLAPKEKRQRNPTRCGKRCEDPGRLPAKSGRQ
jgi:hypothetical protein